MTTTKTISRHCLMSPGIEISLQQDLHVYTNNPVRWCVYLFWAGMLSFLSYASF